MDQITIKHIDYHSLLSEQEINDIETEVEHYELREAAAIEALKIVQQHRRWIDDDRLAAIAELLCMSPAQLEGIATFYNHIYRQPVGEYVIHICDSISCWLTGYTELAQAMKDELNIDYGQTTSDGRFTLLTNPCLGSCDKAPAMTINGQYHENLTVDSALTIIRQLKETNDG